MAVQKPTVVFSPALSKILDACGIDHSICKIDVIADRIQQDASFKRTHGMTRNDWDRALSLHLNGDLQ